jgi:DNA (cytosine-5)-methyltransferase 1
MHNDGIRNIGLICGGYPCQPFSLAGKRAGAEDDRHLWPEIKRLLTELIDREEPAPICLFENVTGHVSMGLDSVLDDLESLGYTCQPFIIPACAVGAYHRRDRVWIIAYPMRGRERDSEAVNQPALDEKRNIEAHRKERETVTGKAWGNDSLADGATKCKDASDVRQSSRYTRNDRSRVGAWLPESGIRRVVNGVSGRVDRLKQLGNAVVPQVVEQIGLAIMEAA